MKIYTNDLVKGHSDFKVKCLTFGLYTQVSDSGPLGPLVLSSLVSVHYNYFFFSTTNTCTYKCSVPYFKSERVTTSPTRH